METFLTSPTPLGTLAILPADIRRIIYSQYPGICARLSKKILIEVQPIITSLLDSSVSKWELLMLIPWLAEHISGYINDLVPAPGDLPLGLSWYTTCVVGLTSQVKVELFRLGECSLTLFVTQSSGQFNIVCKKRNVVENAGIVIPLWSLKKPLEPTTWKIRPVINQIALWRRHNNPLRAGIAQSSMKRAKVDKKLSSVLFSVDDVAAWCGFVADGMIVTNTYATKADVTRARLLILRDCNLECIAQQIECNIHPYYTLTQVRTLVHSMFVPPTPSYAIYEYQRPTQQQCATLPIIMLLQFLRYQQMLIWRYLESRLRVVVLGEDIRLYPLETGMGSKQGWDFWNYCDLPPTLI